MKNDQKTNLLVGCAAGFSGDRTDAALPVVQALIASGQPAVLIFETLAERTLALAQLARRTDPDAGYEPLLVDLLRPVLAQCLAHGVRIVSNFGAANPAGAARRIHQLAAELGLRAPRIAVVQGDGVLANRKHTPRSNFVIRAQIHDGGHPQINDQLGVIWCQSIQTIGSKQRSPTGFSPVSSRIAAQVTKVDNGLKLDDSFIK